MAGAPWAMTAPGVPSVEAECPAGEGDIALDPMSAAEATAGTVPAAETAMAGPDGETEPVVQLPAPEKQSRVAA